jgi:hypothetical protein
MDSPSTFGVIVHRKIILQDLAPRFLLFPRLATVTDSIHESHVQSPRTDVLNNRALPLGDGKVSAEPMRGYVYPCRSQFRVSALDTLPI